MSRGQDKPTIAITRFNQLLSQSRSLMLGTVDGQARPLVSYAPFWRQPSGDFYVYLSSLSAHTPALHSNPVASVLLIEDETASVEIFARTRISYYCDAQAVARGDPEHGLILDRMARRFGDVMELLQSLPDFVLFRLKPKSGRFVMGFGQAYELAGERLDRLTHVGPDQVDPG